MGKAQELLDAYNNLEQEMQQFSGLASKVLNSISNHEFVPERVNTDMMQSIIELNKKEKDCFKLYNDLKLGNGIPKQMSVMKAQIEEKLKSDKKEDYLDSVKKSFMSLYSEDSQVEDILKEYKEKIKNINTEKYTVEECLIYIKPYAVFLSMIKEDDPVKSIERVPVLIEYFGSELVAHITVVKDIHIGEDAEDFSVIDGAQKSDSKDDEADAAEAKDVEETKDVAETKDASDTDESKIIQLNPEKTDDKSEDSSDKVDSQKENEDRTLSDELEHIKNEEAKKDAQREKIERRIKEEEQRREKQRKLEAERKENLKAVLEEESFSESKLDDQELRDMQDDKEKKRKWCR